MTSKKLGHSYSHKKGRHSEALFIRSSNVVEKKKFLRRKSRENSKRKPDRDFKIRVWAQIEISKLESGASSNLVGFRGLALTKISSEEGV